MRLFGPITMGVLMDPITAVAGGVGLVGNVVSGIMGNSAAKTAGQIQSTADTKAANDVTAATAAANPAIGTAAQGAGDLAQSGAMGVTSAAANATKGVNGASTSANDILDPYSTAGQSAAGTLQQGLTPGGDFNKTPTLSDLQMDPGYAFRLQQGNLALSRSAAARGAGDSGSAIKDAINYNSGAASQEYQNAFNRYETSTQNRYSNLFGVANAGQQAGTTQGANLMNAAQYGGNITTGAANTQLGANEYQGAANMNATDLQAANTINTAKTAADYLTGGAAAQASGIVGGTNALTKGITGGIGAGTSAITLSQLLQNPALQPINGTQPGGGQSPLSGLPNYGYTLPGAPPPVPGYPVH